MRFRAVGEEIWRKNINEKRSGGKIFEKRKWNEIVRGVDIALFLPGVVLIETGSFSRAKLTYVGHCFVFDQRPTPDRSGHRGFNDRHSEMNGGVGS